MSTTGHDGKISKPISITDIKTTVGSTSNDVGTLCTSDKINKWAKYKPVVLTNIAPDPSSAWWRGNDGQCGLVIAKHNGNPSTISDFSWEYQPPTGGAFSPYRMGDFVGYNGQAQPFLKVAEFGDINIENTTSNPYYFYLNVIPLSTGADNLQATDLYVNGQQLSSYYPAVCISTINGTTETARLYSCASTPLYHDGAITGMITADLAKMVASVQTKTPCKVRFFLASAYFTERTSWNLADITSVPMPEMEDSFPCQTVQIGAQSAVNSVFLNLAGADMYSLADVSQYVSEGHPMAINRPNTMFYYKIRISNHKSSAYTLNLADIRMTTSNWNSQQVTRQPLGLYTASGASRTSIDCPANTDTDIIVAWRFNMTEQGGTISPTTPTTISARINQFVVTGIDSWSGGAGFYVTFRQD